MPRIDGHPPDSPGPAARIGRREAFWTWVRVAIFSFGGPAGQMAVMHRILVEERRWVSENRFLHALNYTMLLPGPEAMQLATYIGWLAHGTLGGLTAGILFVLPGFATILALSVLYAGFQEVSFVQGLFYGLKPAVMAIVIEAVFRIGKRALKNRVMVGLAGLAFLAIFFFDAPFPLIVLTAGLVGLLGGWLWEPHFYVVRAQGPVAGQVENPAPARIVDSPSATPPSTARSLRVLATWSLLWLGPLAALSLFLGPDSIFTQIGVFFSKAAVVTFGGAYAVLAYIAQEAVSTYSWLLPGEMLDGLGMAETTPGPLIQVVQFVGFMGAYRHAGSLTPMLSGILASVLTTWVTFTPCFLWIFLGAPYIEHMRGNKSLSTALSAITAAVVGVVLNLGVWFSLHTLFLTVDEITLGPLRLWVPAWGTLDWVALSIGLAAFLALFRFRLGMLATLAGSAGAGLFLHLLIR